MAAELSFNDLLSDSPSPGDGALVGIQGAPATGKSTLACNADGPVLYAILDPNSRALNRTAEVPEQISWAHLYPPSGDDVPLEDRQAYMKKVNVLWNGFLAGAKSPWGEPYKTFVWDTATRLWDAVYPTKVGEKLGNSNRQPGPLDFVKANDWMRQISLQRANLRPDAYVIVLLHEQPLYVEDPERPGSTFKIAHATKRVYDGWKETDRDLNAFFRLVRKPEKITVGGKLVTQEVRYGVIIKHPNEQLIGMELREPTWSDVKEWLDG